jgi:RNA polymerase sigma-70 factor (ECF subfamily)
MLRQIESAENENLSIQHRSRDVLNESLSDEELAAEYLQDRSPKVFETLMRRYEREMYAFLRRYLGSEDQAEDAFQATFITVHLRIDQYELGRRFRPWLYAIATNKAIDLKRHLKRRAAGSLDSGSSTDTDDNWNCLRSSIPSRESTPLDASIQSEQAMRVRALIHQMNEPTQQLLQMVFYQGMKYSDISEALNIPVGTVKSRVFNAMRKLNEVWQRMYPGTTPDD